MDTITAAYLNRLGVEAERPSAEALARLHRAHVERVPYETFWIHLAQGWGIDPAESTRRVATSRRGGYCYHLNGAFRTLLTALGYQVSVNVGQGSRWSEVSVRALILLHSGPLASRSWCISDPRGSTSHHDHAQRTSFVRTWLAPGRIRVSGVVRRIGPLD